jgi:hypothetical protein
MSNSKIGRNDAGGAAGQAGANYQSRIAAWFGVRMLAGSMVSPLYGLAANVRFSSVRCQTDCPVDDVVVATSENGFVFIQAKNRIAAVSGAPGSEFAEVITQFVRQFLAMQQGGEGIDWRRPLDSDKDRLVLATGSRSTSTLTGRLRGLLERFRESSGASNLEAAARNKSEREVATKLLGHVRRVWEREIGSVPKDTELRPLLEAMRIHELDMGEEGRDTRDARDLLCSQVLSDPSQAEAAWSALVDVASQRHERRSGFIAASLAEELRHQSFALQSPPDFRGAIETLQATSGEHLNEVCRFSQLLPGQSETTIRRDATGTLIQAVEEGHLLVVGEPGAGKTGILYQLACQLAEQGASVVFLSVQFLTATTAVDLSRALSLVDSQDLTEILANWFETERGYVIFDALDAARNEPTRLLLQQKINEIIRLESRWTVIASVREYDLRYGERWRNMFPGEAREGFGVEEFSGTRHMYLSRLSGAEIARAVDAVPGLTSVLTNPPPRLRDLLENIFNLHLMAVLIREQADPTELRTICYQIQLLHRYWRGRVHGDGTRRDARERAIVAVLKCMVTTRLMQAERHDILADEPGADLSDLEQTGILRSPAARRGLEGDILIFSHHILFDYAVARLSFRLGRRPRELVERLEREPDLALMLGPSLSLCFEDAWLEQTPARHVFWRLATALSFSGAVPEIAKLVAPTTVAVNASSLDDLEPLLGLLGRGAQAIDDLLWHLVVALLIRIDDGNPIVGETGGPWAAFADRLSERIGPRSIYSLRTLVSILTQKSQELTADQLASSGRAARRLLEAGWAGRPRDRNLVITGLDAVCDTFTSDLEASASLIRRSLEFEHLRQFGYEELPHITHKLETFMGPDPNLAVELYRAAFGYEEMSTEGVPMGGVLLSLTSNRRQDYRHSWWQLAEMFPKLLELNPIEATRALIAVMEGYNARERHRGPSDTEVTRTFDFNGRVARYREDLSGIWAQRAVNQDTHDDALRILSVFSRFLREVAQRADCRELFANIVEAVVAHNELAVLWATLLQAAADDPEPFASEVIPVAVAPVVLTSSDTHYAVARYFEKAYPLLEESSRARIEQAILDLPHESKRDNRNRLRLVGYLPQDSIVIQEAQELRTQAEMEELIRESRPLFTEEPFLEEVPNIDDQLTDEGVDVNRAANRALIDFIRAVHNLRFEQDQNQHNLEHFHRMRPALEALREGILNAGEDVDPKVIEEALDHLGDKASQAARFRVIGENYDARVFLLTVLRMARLGRSPEYSEERNANFARHRTWGSPSARIAAARGLMDLISWNQEEFAELQPELDRLARDPVASVRFHVAIRLPHLNESQRDWVRAHINFFTQEDDNAALVNAGLQALSKTAYSDFDEAFFLAAKVYERFRDAEHEGEELCRDNAAKLVADLHIRLGHEGAGQWLHTILENEHTPSAVINELIVRYRDEVTRGDPDDSDSRAEASRGRTLALYRRVTGRGRDRAMQLWEDLQSSLTTEWPEEKRQELQNHFRILDNVAQQMYFASGAHGAQSDQRQQAGRIQSRLFAEARDLFETLSQIPVPHVSHYLIETLEFLIDIEPEEVFRLLAQAVRSSEGQGYTAERMAQGLFVRITERYLADYRNIFDDPERRQDLLLCLNAFVRHGWLEARRLTYRISEIWQ